MLLTGGIVTGGAGATVARGESRYAGRVMDGYADEVAGGILAQAGRYGETLHDLALAVGARSDVGREDFFRMTAGLYTIRLPGAAGISFVVPATTAQVATVQRTWRGRGAAGLTLRPAATGTRHAFVVFERPLDGNYTVPGLDLLQRSQATKALDGARQENTLAISPAFQLLRDQGLDPTQRQASIIFAVPVYARAGSGPTDVFEGWIVMPVRGQDFLAQTLLDSGDGAVQASVVEATKNGAVLATVDPGRRERSGSLVRHRVLALGQRRWELTLWPNNRLLAATDRGMTRFTLAVGAALTIMLAVMTGVLADSRSRALQQVDQATAALRGDIARREHVETQLREREQQLHHLAFHDPLTGLANRALFYERLTHALETHARSQRLLAVLFVDLDGFKQVNDRLGHHAGDTVLRTVADRLRAGLRTVDTVARFGGDEFALILEGLTAVGDARMTAERVITDVQAPIDVAGAPAYVSTSIGIAISHPGASADDLVRGADTAMYTAKNTGKNRYVEARTPG